MLFAEYRADFYRKLARLRLPADCRQIGSGPEAKSRPAMPPWMTDWAILYADDSHIRVKEYYIPDFHPNYAHGVRKHFCFQYGATTGVDRKGMPRTASDRDTVVRLDLDDFGPHLHFGGRAHVKQHEITGTLVINDIDLFEFIEAVETHRQSGCSITEVLFFELQGRN